MMGDKVCCHHEERYDFVKSLLAGHRWPAQHEDRPKRQLTNVITPHRKNTITISGINIHSNGVLQTHSVWSNHGGFFLLSFFCFVFVFCKQTSRSSLTKQTEKDWYDTELRLFYYDFKKITFISFCQLGDRLC